MSIESHIYKWKGWADDTRVNDDPIQRAERGGFLEYSDDIVFTGYITLDLDGFSAKCFHHIHNSLCGNLSSMTEWEFLHR
jgi:hypothetical protein